MKSDIFTTDPNIDTMHLYWASEKPEKIFKCPIFEVSKVKRQSQDGRVGDFITVDCPEWVVIIPIFKDENLLASGVLMEAYSLEDNGEGIKFNVFVYNAQPGITIDYKTGESKLQS